MSSEAFRLRPSEYSHWTSLHRVDCGWCPPAR
jgi:hypothetical protein